MIRLAIIALVLGAAGCVVGLDGKPEVLLRTVALDGGACPLGGQLVNSGVDSNGDGILQPSEVTSSIPVCDSPSVQSGETSASYVNPGWLLDHGTGDRYFHNHVGFPVEFATVPTVVVALRWIDTSTPQRVEVSASAIDTKGFTFTVRTWESSVVTGVIASWVAYTH